MTDTRLPGMGGDGPFGGDSGRRRLPLVPVETFHLLRRRRRAEDEAEAADPKEAP